MKKVMKICFGISFLLYIFFLAVILFLDARGYQGSEVSLIEYIRNSSNFVPFKTIRTYFQAMLDGSMNRDIPIKNLVGNVILFLPMGIYLPFFIRKIKKISVFFIPMLLLLFIIEVLQLITRRGSFDIDDLILNMLGALVGFGIWKTNIVQRVLA